MRTDFLFVQPSLLRGAGRVLDMWGHLNQYNMSLTSADADLIALRADWEMIAKDFREGLHAATHNDNQASLFAR